METFLLLGANLGDRVTTMSRAVELIAQQVGKIIRQSSLYETAPWGVTEQPSYLNQVLLVETALAPQPLLEHTQAIEYELGRVRLDKWGARLIDIDILYYEQQAIRTETLSIPHPYLHLRRFTLMPLTEIAPHYRHPVLQKTTQELLNECPDTSDVAIFNF
ncbi:2-amino-4-hydroxy-6-hydroxymethyldihydropteridine diphosphokinase [Spirosoma oryzicola]|uniref:2-amino-4-hydroxy-6- hydroxymethyldihydropteridine diphosphokinase n=1 Tax=Spirosoma oryzicola TaxID=2898794 RepID=UPI001E2B50AC|nr:2-amino-4-hydroxy-6-hydroxymethyldihydropteridine diphosphokinase [Spirosoma oryzicola]UHG91675.1 2-amino-4-hydroxy-6-hydroxymethyldihydropteridine diphosphokinase [Spirosoma oryzicola]